MPRYIDADALLEKLPDDLPYKASVKRVLTQANTADMEEQDKISIEEYRRVYLSSEQWRITARNQNRIIKKLQSSLAQAQRVIDDYELRYGTQDAQLKTRRKVQFLTARDIYSDLHALRCAGNVETPFVVDEGQMRDIFHRYLIGGWHDQG